MHDLVRIVRLLFKNKIIGIWKPVLRALARWGNCLLWETNKCVLWLIYLALFEVEVATSRQV